MRSIARGIDKTGGHGPSQKYDNLARFFADTVTGPYNQDISFLMVGKKGTGKSYCQISIAYRTACEIAEIMGGEWRDYFDIDRNVAIIDPERAGLVMGVQDKYAVKVFDDIGVGWSSRDWQKDENKAKNDIFQINRVDNQVQMFSVPNQFLLDKVPRSLVSHYAETYQQYFKLGFVTIKLFEPQTMFREGKIIQPYLSINRNKFVVYAITKPPSELTKAYNLLRAEVTKKIVQMRKEKIDGSPGSHKPRITKRQIAMETKAKMVIERADQIRLKGEDPNAAIFAAGEELKINKSTIRNWMRDGVIRNLGYAL